MLITITAALLLQSPCEVVLADSVGDQLLRLADFEPDGSILELNEATPLWRESSNRTPRALALRYEAGRPAVYWIDSSLDRVHRGEDVNENGEIELFERSVVRNTGALDGPSTARSLALTNDGAVWWCSDGGLRGLFRMRDLDGDGAFQGTSEFEVLVGGNAASQPVETDAGVQVIDTGNLTEVVAEGGRVVTYGDGPDELLCAFRSLDEDGDLLDPGEARLFLNASGKNPAFPQGADWAVGKLRSLAIAASGGGFFYGRLSKLAVDESGPVPIWYLACDSAYRSPYDTNQYGQGLNGLVFRGEDMNGDGDLQDLGEVRLFYDGSHTSSQPRLEEITAVDVCGGAVYVAYNELSVRRVARLVDLNQSGTAEGSSEVDFDWFDSALWTGLSPLEQGPPEIRDLIAVPSQDLALPNPLFQSLGPGCEYTQFGQPPTLHGVGRAVIGTKSFKIELRGAPGGSYALLLAGDDAPNWFTFFLPANLGFMGWPKCYQYLNPTFLWRKWTSGSTSDPMGGYAKHIVDIPLDPNLIGFHLRTQWIVYDWFGGISYSGGGEVELEAPD